MASYHRLGPAFLSKVDITDTYMIIWDQLNNITSVEFITPKETDSEPQLVGFHLSIPMGYVEYEPTFCATMEKIKYTSNNTMHNRGKHPVHLLEILTDTPPCGHNQLW